MADAVGMSQEIAQAQQRKIYVAGGLFLAIEYRTVAQGGRIEDLAFF
jgi:dihydrofolate synthase/folylpolyglutamate synthase